MGRKAKKYILEQIVQKESEPECIGLLGTLDTSGKSPNNKKRTKSEVLGFVAEDDEIESECSQKRQRIENQIENTKTPISLKALSSVDLEIMEIQNKRVQKEQDKIRKQRLYSKIQKQFQEEKSSKYTEQYKNLIKQSLSIRQKEFGFVQTKIKATEKKDLPFQNLCETISKKQVTPILKNMTSEEIEMYKLEKRGAFKARPFRDNFDIFSSKLENQSMISKSVEFKEFKLKTQNLFSSQKLQGKIEQIKKEEAAKYEYKPFKALKFNGHSITNIKIQGRQSVQPEITSGKIECSKQAIRDLQRHDRQSMPPPTNEGLSKAIWKPNFKKVDQNIDKNEDLQTIDSSRNQGFKAQEPSKVKQFLSRKFNINPARQSITVPNQPILQLDEQKTVGKNNKFRLSNKNKYQEPEYMEFKF